MKTLNVKMITLLFVMQFMYISSQAQWNSVNTGTDYNLFSITSFETGRLLCCGASGTIIISDDNGESWSVKSICQESVVAVDSYDNICLAATNSGYIYESEDYGDTWQWVNSCWGVILRGLYVQSPTQMYACGQGEMLFDASDPLQSWQPIPYVTGSYWLRDVMFSDPQNGYVVGAGGRAYKTPNSGYGWFLMNTGTTADLKSLWFNCADTGYICGYSSALIKTTDGGITWQNTYSGEENQFQTS